MHITARITFIHVFIRSSNIWLSYILNRIFIRANTWPAPCLQAQCDQNPSLLLLVGCWATTSWRNYHQAFSATTPIWDLHTILIYISSYFARFINYHIENLWSVHDKILWANSGVACRKENLVNQRKKSVQWRNITTRQSRVWLAKYYIYTNIFLNIFLTVYSSEQTRGLHHVYKHNVIKTPPYCFW